MQTSSFVVVVAVFACLFVYQFWADVAEVCVVISALFMSFGQTWQNKNRCLW